MATRTACSFFLVLPVAIIIGLLSHLCAAGNILYSPERLNAGQYLALGNYKLIMQADCNFVLYDGGVGVWSTRTSNVATNCYVTMQSDGNLVIYGGLNSRAVWASNSYQRGSRSYVLILQRDRNVVIYGGVWATGTHVHGTGAVVDNDGGLAARRNETSSPLGSVAVVVNNNGLGEELNLGWKISNVTTKEISH